MRSSSHAGVTRQGRCGSGSSATSVDDTGPRSRWAIAARGFLRCSRCARTDHAVCTAGHAVARDLRRSRAVQPPLGPPTLAAACAASGGLTGHDLSLASDVESTSTSTGRSPSACSIRHARRVLSICACEAMHQLSGDLLFDWYEDGSGRRPQRGGSCASTPSRRSRAGSAGTPLRRRPPPPASPCAPIRCARARGRRSSARTSPRATSPMRWTSSSVPGPDPHRTRPRADAPARRPRTRSRARGVELTAVTPASRGGHGLRGSVADVNAVPIRRWTGCA